MKKDEGAAYVFVSYENTYNTNHHPNTMAIPLHCTCSLIAWTPGKTCLPSLSSWLGVVRGCHSRVWWGVLPLAPSWSDSYILGLHASSLSRFWELLLSLSPPIIKVEKLFSPHWQVRSLSYPLVVPQTKKFIQGNSFFIKLFSIILLSWALYLLSSPCLIVSFKISSTDQNRSLERHLSLIMDFQVISPEDTGWEPSKQYSLEFVPYWGSASNNISNSIQVA